MRYSFLLLLPVLALLAGCGGNESQTHAAAPAAAIPVSAAPAAFQSWPELYEAAGTVCARAFVTLSSRVMAYVREVAPQVGDRVRAGQRLIALDSEDLEVNVRRAETAEAEVAGAMPEADHGMAAAKANLDLAQSTFRRMEELAAQKSISNQEFDEASARLKSAQAAYDMARAKRSQLDTTLARSREEVKAARITLGYASIAAPFDGVVTVRSAEPGTLAAPGAPLLTLERDGGYRLEVAVEESKLPFVKNGQSIEIALEALDRRMTARVSEIVPAVDPASRAYTVKIDLPSLPNVRSGLFGRAWFPMGDGKTLAVPQAALVERGQLQSVFVVEETWARARLVTTGRHSAGAIEVLSGLSEGERVIVPVPDGLADGARVEVRQ